MEKVEKSIKEYIADHIRTIPDFPKPGIRFKDITTLLKDKKALELTSYMLAQPFIGKQIDFVVGLESRGFLFGTILAQQLNAGFIPVRKPGRLPGESLSQTYALEYGEDSVEIHKDAFPDDAKILIHDDLIATGGTALAASKLINRMGGEIIGYSFIIELAFLKGRAMLEKNVPIEVIITE